jgi:hypothetical protein
MRELFDYPGVIHFHSRYSFDGRASMEEILRSARETGVRFLLLTDHSTLEARRDGWEGWHDGVLVAVGQEIAPRFNHYLAFGIDRSYPVGEEDHPAPEDYIRFVNGEGGFGFIAHPDHEGTEVFHVKHYPWIDWNARGYAGIGIWDFMTDWQSSLTGTLRALISYAAPAFFLRGPRPVTLSRWELLNETAPVPGIGELDNHDTVKRFLGISFPVFPFRRVFRLIRTHVLLDRPFEGDAAKDIAAVFDALRRGRSYVSLDAFRDPRGFRFSVSSGGAEAFPGERVPLADGARGAVDLPFPGVIRVIRNGRPLLEEAGRSLRFAVDGPGRYRVEAFLKKLRKRRPWIYSNPVYVEGA